MHLAFDRPRSEANDASSPARWKVNGTRLPSTYSAMRGRGFSSFAYEPSEKEKLPPKLTYGQPNPKAQQQRPQSGGLRDRPVFKFRALPTAPKQAGTFQRFRYTIQVRQPDADAQCYGGTPQPHHSFAL